MADKQAMQADGGGKPVAEKVQPDKGSESNGGAYPNPHTGKEAEGFDGGQSDKRYRGPGNPNAPTE